MRNVTYYAIIANLTGHLNVKVLKAIFNGMELI